MVYMVHTFENEHSFSNSVEFLFTCALDVAKWFRSDVVVRKGKFETLAWLYDWLYDFI